MFILKIFTYLAGVVTVGLFGYLYTVLEETGQLEQVMAMPKDDIMIYHIVAGVVIAWLIFSLVMKVVARGLIIVLLLFAVGAEGIFVGLNINGTIIEENQMLNEFKDFIAKGNVMELAVAVIIGGAFATIVGSLTEDLIMPIVSAIFGGADFTNKFILMGAVPDGVAATDYAALKAAGVAMLGYGAFITALINFLILAFVIFLLVRWVSKMMAKKEEEDAGPSEVDLLIEIRDALKK
mgnify:CR=1 FL=1